MKDTPENPPESAPKVPFLSSHPFVASGDVLVNYDVDCPDCKKRTRWSADVTGSWCHECCLFVSRDIITDAPIITSEDLIKTPQPLAVPEEVEKCIVCGGDEPGSHDFDAMKAPEAKGIIFLIASPPSPGKHD